MKSLGMMKWPSVEIESMNFSENTFIVKFSTNGKYVRMTLGLWAIRELIRITHEAIGRFQRHLIKEQSRCDRFKEETTYKEPK